MIVREADINITNACNLNCIHCAFSSCASSKMRLDLAIFQKCINELCSLGLEDVHLTGGEPTLHPDLEKMIEFTAMKGVNVRLITNGYALNKSRLLEFKKRGLKSIMISVDGLEKTHNMIRGRTDAFLRTVETIKLAKDIGYNVRVNAVVSKLNAAEMKDLILYIAKLDVDVFSFFLYSPTGRNASSQLDNVIGAFEWKKLISELRENIKPSDVGKLQIAFEKGYYYFNNDRMDFSTYRGRGGGCYHLNSICDYLILLANGDVYPCALLTDKDIPYGNVNRNSIKEILSNRNNIEIYREFEKKSDRCTNCASWNFCKGACKAFVFAHYGKWNRSDPRCSDNTIKEYIPLCPLHKENFFTGQESGYSELVVR